MEHLNILKHSPLFDGISESDIPSLLTCLSAVKRRYKKGETILRYGENIHAVGLVLCGAAHIFKDDFWGARVIIGEASAGNLFGESYACYQAETLEVNVVAAENTGILLIDVKRILTTCSSSCAFHSRLIRNLLSILAEKNLMLTRKIDHMAKRTTREKLLSYLFAESLRAENAAFKIPYNRQQLADYLCVDRSAMSAELSKMKKEGLLEYDKNHFCLKGATQRNGGIN